MNQHEPMTANTGTGTIPGTPSTPPSHVLTTPPKRSIGRIAAALTLTVCLLILILTAIAHLAPWPSLSAVADIATPFALHAAIIAAGASLALLSRSTTSAVLSATILITILAHAGQSLQHTAVAPFPAHTPDDGTATSRKERGGVSQSLNILTLNAWHHHPEPARLERTIASANADIVVMTETGPTRSPMLKRLAAVYPYTYSCAAQWECALTILSRLPLITGGAGRERLDTPPIVWARVDASSRNLGFVTVLGAHLHRPTRSPWLHRLHAEYLARLVASVPGPRILAGDFNTTPYSKSYRMLLNKTAMQPAAMLQPTWPASPILLPQFAIDHVFVSSDLRINSAGAGPHVGSDHLPLWATVSPRVQTAPPPASPAVGAAQ